MKNKKKILFVVPSLCRAGAETQVVDLANNLDPDSFVKYLFTFEKKLDQLERLARDEISFYNQPRRYKFDFAPARTIAGIIEKERIDTVHCTLQIALLMGWLGAKLSRLSPRIVLALHTTVNRDRKDDLLDFALYQWLMRSCDSVICVCKTQEAHWLRRFPFLSGRTSVIYNGVDTDYFNPSEFIEKGQALRQSLGIKSQDSAVSCIAGFRPEKGHAILLDAFQRARQARKNIKLILAGDGPLRPRIEQAVRDQGMYDDVKFLGNVQDVRPVLAASDISIIASTAVETFSMAMLESMSMQVPLVATDIGGTAEAVLHGKTGMVVPPHNSAILGESILSMLQNDAQRRVMGIAARSLVQERFRKSEMVSRTAELLGTS